VLIHLWVYLASIMGSEIARRLVASFGLVSVVAIAP
jgi:hypothetical protein